MKIFLLSLIFLSVYGCNKPKTVLICGDHVCINKAEARSFFEENLSLEVKVLDKKNLKEINLVELNLKPNSENNREISIQQKKQTNLKIKKLTRKEIKKKKNELKNKVKKQKLLKEITLKEKNKIKKKSLKNKRVTKPKSASINSTQKTKINNIKSKKTVNKTPIKIVDVCTVLEKCSIDEISKFLVEQGKNEKFPDITTREN
tara:strand:+ start:2458 stop:3066 length:609 start_codon:yes stop_codon:yes gene_type:complete